MQQIASALRAAGDFANVVAMLFFGLAAICLKNTALAQYTAAGGMPTLSRSTLDALVADPESVLRYGHLVAAWGIFVAAVGSAWMFILGVRWTYHLGVRVLNR
jgi:hypothetical protein